ncbi:MAG TPA: Calx-beta domain-containing protein [Kiritimatiellia bacterium]|nr:Calx-beta domain-containing protein [Kiritimatiellia bacterium]
MKRSITLPTILTLLFAGAVFIPLASYAQTTNYFTGFEDATKGSYAAADVTLSGISWNFTEALIGTDANDRKNGTKAARMRTNNVAALTMLADITNGAGVVSFLHAKFGSDGNSEVALDYSTDGGSIWVNAGTTAVESTTLTLYSTNINQTGNVRLRIRKTAGTASQRPNIDDITVLAPGEAPAPTTNVQFTTSSASIGEAGGAYTVTVYKTLAEGNVSGSVTLGGTATEGADYSIDTTNFTMNGATTSATFVITINDDGDTESAETVTLTLANVLGGTISPPSVFTLTITDNDGTPPPSGEPWINEFNYDPPGTDSNEFVEIAGPAGLDLAAYRIVLYNGSGGAVYSTIAGSGLIPDEGCGFGAIAFDAVGLQNGAPDGIALAKVDAGVTSLVQFISYEGEMTGVGGPADGVLSEDVGTQNGVIETLQATGTGAAYADFTWATGTISRGVLNVGQTIEPCGGGGPATNVKFSASSASVAESVGSYTVTVHKTLAEGNVSGSVTLGGTAATPADYTIDTTNFTMNGATTSATFVITVNDDGDTESAETVTLTLANVTGGTISSPSVFTLTINDNDVLPPPSLNVWVNELHYDNAGGDVNEGVEIAGPAGTDLTGYSLHFYDGLVGGLGVYFVTNITGVIPDQSNGFGAIWVDCERGGDDIQNGSADGFALVFGSTQVIQFLSYEGTFTATSGPAAGLTSTDIGVQEGSTTPEGWSLQLCGSGTNYAAFAWSTNLPHSRGLLNECQSIPGGGSGYTPEQEGYILVHWGTVGAYTGDEADDDGDGFSNLEEFIAGTIPVPPTGASSFFEGTALTNGASRFVVFPTQTGRLYRLWSTPALFPTQTWTSVAGPTAGTGGDVSLTDGVNTNLGVYRLSVELD